MCGGGGGGGGGGGLGEPVGIAIDAEARQILVADAGNARIQRFDAALRPIAQYAVKEWEDLDPTNKPDLAVLPDGRLLVSDPAHGRLMLLATDGLMVATLDSVGGEALAAPRGIAFDAAGGFVF